MKVNESGSGKNFLQEFARGEQAIVGFEKDVVPRGVEDLLKAFVCCFAFEVSDA